VCVNFNRGYEFTDEAVTHPAEKCQSLQSVSFKWCDKLASTSRRSTGAYRA